MGAVPRPRGFTLVELLVVIGVIALIAGLATPALGTLTGANVRKAASELAGTIRAMHDTAALRHTTCRIALDPGTRTWWAECAPGAVAVARDADRREDDEDLARRFPDEKNEDARRLLAKTQFAAYGDRLVQKRELPGSAGFGEIRVEGRRGSEGKTAYLYFFAGGQAQRAFVPVVDGSHLFTVVVEPFTGRARVVAGAVEVRD